MSGRYQLYHTGIKPFISSLKRATFIRTRLQRRSILEFRSCLLPSRFPAAALLRGRFRFPELGEKPDYMHFHNCMEPGVRLRSDCTPGAVRGNTLTQDIIRL